MCTSAGLPALQLFFVYLRGPPGKTLQEETMLGHRAPGTRHRRGPPKELPRSDRIRKDMVGIP